MVDLVFRQHNLDYKVTLEAGGWEVRVRLEDGSEERYAYDPEGRTRTIEGIETRARLLCLAGAGASWTLLGAPWARDRASRDTEESPGKSYR